MEKFDDVKHGAALPSEQGRDIAIERRNQLMAEMYRDGFSMTIIGERFGLSRERVRQVLSRMGLEGRKSAKIRKLMPTLLDEAELRRLYVDECWTQIRLCEHFKVPRSVIFNNLRRYGIERGNVLDRLKNKLTREVLEELYHGRGMTQHEIAREYGILQTQVSELLKLHGLSVGRGNRQNGWREPKGLSRKG